MARGSSRTAGQSTSSEGSVLWNALTSPWLEVMDNEGLATTVSPLNALSDAAFIHRLAIANPLDLFSAHRFLLTLLYWKADAAGGVDKTRQSLLAGKIPKTVLAELTAADEHFNLFDATKPFLQDTTVRNAKVLSAASLFAEIPSGTNIAHFHHVDDDAARLCLPCAVLGLLRLVPWTQSGGAGKQPSIHGAPPVMALAMGSTLCKTLGLNLIPMTGPVGKPQWTGQFTPAGRKGGVALLEALTWNPRRVHLLDPQPPALCSQCGDRHSPTVGPIVYEKNPACKQPDEYVDTWRDPAAFYRSGDARTTKSTNEADATAGTDVRRLFNQKFGQKIEPAPASLVGEANASHGDWLVVMPCTNPANNKSYDHRLEAFTALTGDAPQPPLPWDKSHAWQAGDPRTLARLASNESLPTLATRRFVSAAARLDDASWGVLANAANRSMEDDPAAFDIFTGIYWPLRNKHSNMPSRAAAWMALKLMATAGRKRPSPSRQSGAFRPWAELSRSASPVKEKPYPKAIPSGRQLEAELRDIICRRFAAHPTSEVDWNGLCQFLHEVIQ